MLKILLTSLLITATAQASGFHESYNLGTLITAKALNATAATRTLTVGPTLGGRKLLDFGLLVVTIDYTNSAASTVTMSCTATSDGGTTDAAIQSCSTSAGLCTSTDMSWSNAVSADEVFVWRVDVSGFKRVDCVLGGASADGSDLVTVTGYLVSL